MAKTSKRKLTDSGAVYFTLYKHLITGLVRTIDAEIGLLLAQRFFITHKRAKKRSGKPVIPPGFNRQSFDYVVTASLLVYCVSIFDVFLSDLTRGLLLNNIASLGQNCVVPIAVLASPAASIEIIKKEVEKKVRNIAYKNFEERLEFLRATFSMHLSLEQKEQSSLKRISELRNKLVHDQSLHTFHLDHKHRPSIQIKGNPRKPVFVSLDDVDEAGNLFKDLGARIYQSIKADILKHEIELEDKKS